MSTTTIRSYEISDTKMLRVATLFSNLLEQCKSEFYQCYPKLFPLTFCDQLRCKVDEAYAFQGDHTCLNQQAAKSDELRKVEKAFLHKYRAIRIVIEDAFADEPDKLTQLGVGTITAKRQSRDLLFNFAELFCQLIREYEIRLKEFGCTETLLVSLETLLEQMKQLRVQRDRSKVDRQNSKVARITLHNEIWSMMSSISRAAPFALEQSDHNPAHFALPRRAKKRKAVENTVIDSVSVE